MSADQAVLRPAANALTWIRIGGLRVKTKQELAFLAELLYKDGMGLASGFAQSCKPHIAKGSDNLRAFNLSGNRNSYI